MCTNEAGVESVCDENKLIETQRVMLQGNMSETGVEVKKLKLLK